MAADRQSGSGNGSQRQTEVRGLRNLWAWSAPAFVTLALIWLLVHRQGGGITGTARWSEQQATFLAWNAAFSVLPPELWSVITVLGDATVLLLLLALFLLCKPQVWAAALASAPAAALLSTSVKHWAEVSRPAAILDQLVFILIGPEMHHNSFPSGHAITAFAAAAAVLATLVRTPDRVHDWALMACCLLGAAIIALSRVAVGAHWPLDLAAGAAIGWLAGLSGAALARHPGWWDWLFQAPGRQALGLGLILWGLLLWFRPQDTLTSAAVHGLAGLSGMVVGVTLLLTRTATRALPLPIVTGSSAPGASSASGLRSGS